MKKIMRKSRNIYGMMMMFTGAMLLVPVAIVAFYPSDYVYIPYFAVPGILSVLLGRGLCLRQKSMENVFREKKGSCIVLFAWAYGFLLSAAPFLALREYTASQILFESVSGLTTTGLSVLDVSVMPHIFLFYRSFLQFMGGLGFVMMILVFVQDKDSMELYTAEGHPDRLMPNLGNTARVILGMYSSFLVQGVLLYALCGMPVFDGVLHTMCALSTGGFSNKLASIGAYNSLPVEFVTVFLMLIGTTNFAALLLLVSGKWKKFAKVSEVRFLALLVVLAVPVMTFLLVGQDGYGFGEALRASFFNLFSAVSTTGYATSDYSAWGTGAIGLMIVLMLIGGGAGSTAGGIKLSRVYLAMRNLWAGVCGKFAPEREVRNMYYVKPAEGRAKISGRAIEEASVYIGTYLLLFLLGTLALSVAADCSLKDAMFEFASALGTVGLSIGVTNAEASAAVLWIEIAGMVLGRLEIFTVFLGIYMSRDLFRRRPSRTENCG